MSFSGKKIIGSQPPPNLLDELKSFPIPVAKDTVAINIEEFEDSYEPEYLNKPTLGLQQSIEPQFSANTDEPSNDNDLIPFDETPISFNVPETQYDEFINHTVDTSLIAEPAPTAIPEITSSDLRLIEILSTKFHYTIQDIDYIKQLLHQDYENTKSFLNSLYMQIKVEEKNQALPDLLQLHNNNPNFYYAYYYSENSFCVLQFASTATNAHLQGSAFYYTEHTPFN